MKIIAIILTFSLLLTGCSRSAEECSALSIVERQMPEAQLKSMLKRVALRTQTAAIVANRDGEAFEQKFDAALNNAVKRNLNSWKTNLEKSWSKLNAAELDDVCDAMSKADQLVMMRYMTKVGGEVQTLNEPLLKKAAVEVLAEIDS